MGPVIPTGAHALFLVGSANLDERTFTDPDRADLARSNAAKHLAFGGCLHHCMGAPLARIQLQETVTGLARRFSRIELDGPSSRYPSLIFPSLSTLPVRVH